MITRDQAQYYLLQEIPALARKEYPSKPYLRLYAAISYFSDYTIAMIETENETMVGKCLTTAEKLYGEGDDIVKMLIKNSFIYSLSTLNYYDMKFLVSLCRKKPSRGPFFSRSLKSTLIAMF